MALYGFAENKVVLMDGSRLAGDITTYRLIVDEGTNFEGRCKMIDVPPKTIKEEMENLERPIPSKTKTSSQFLKKTGNQKVSSIKNNNLGIATATLVVAGIFWYII